MFNRWVCFVYIWVAFLFMQNNSHFGAPFEFDPKIEPTFHKLKRQKVLQEVTTTSNMVGGEETQRRTLRDYVTPEAHGQTPSTTMPIVATNNHTLAVHS